MDPFHVWKDDFRREVEEVLDARSRSRASGEAPPEGSFGGRLADMVIPPAGAYAELREATQRLELAQGEVAELRERLDSKERALGREKELSERLKDGVTRLALTLRDERTARVAAVEEAKKTQANKEAAAGALAAARIDAEHAAARAEDWEREALARRLGAREISQRLERAMLDSDAKDADMAALAARLEAAARRASEESARSEERLRELRNALSSMEADLAASRAAAASRDGLSSRLERERLEARAEAESAVAQCARAEASQRAAAARLAALEDELSSQIAGTERADIAVAAARRAEAVALARLAAEVSRREAVLEEESARLRAEFEEARHHLEGEMDVERRVLRERWQEQALALERLRKDVERGRQGT